MASKEKQRCLRSSSTADELDSFLGFKPIQNFPKEKLPTIREVIGFVIHLVDTNYKMSYDTASNLCGETLRKHWIDRNIYPINLKPVKRKVQKAVDEFRKLKGTAESKRTETWKNSVRGFTGNSHKLFDIFCEDEKKREALEKLHGVPMQNLEYEYLESMRNDRIGQCKGVDKTWHLQQEKQNVKLKRREERQYMNSTVANDEEIDEHVEEDANYIDIHEVDENHVSDNDSNDQFEGESSSIATSSKRKTFTNLQNLPFSPIRTRNTSSASESINSKSDFQKHARMSEKNVRDEIYETCAELSGHGFSYYECQIALKVVANRLFGCNWNIPDENRGHTEFTEDDERLQDTYVYDNNTLPTRKAIRQMMQKIEAHSLNLAAEKIIEVKDTDDVVTHATDSTTRKKVGCFSPQGLHINRDTYIPLPTLQLGSETTKNIADSIATGFNILAAASDHTAEDLYSCVDLHMTDATTHNKGVAAEVANLMNREDPAGQLFCNPHTALGYDRCMKKVINNVEQEMDMNNLINCFVLDININQQSDTVSLSVINWMLNLFGPDMVQKPWNYHEDFVTMMKKMGKVTHLFHMKDSRFGLLSLSCAICCFHWEDFEKFLDSHDYITNKLACLVRDGMQHEYVKVVACVIAAFGIHLVIPYHYKTKGKSDHSNLRDFLTLLYENLKSVSINVTFFEFSTPVFSAVSKRLFDGVKNECGTDVLAVVTKYANLHIEECTLLANTMLPHLAVTLSQQRGKFYEFGTHEPEFPVFKQTKNINKAITHNLQLERECGDHDHRLTKKCNISTVSRDNILKICTDLRDESSKSFRTSAANVLKIKRIKDEWNDRQAKLKAAGLTAKESAQLAKENRKMKILANLKKDGGPFTSAEEIVEYMASSVNDSIKQQRMKNEVVYARDSTRSIPAAGILFRIMKVDTNGKRKTMAAHEFAENLKVVLGKENSKSQVSMDDFLLALWKI